MTKKKRNYAYDKEYQKSDERVAYRVELNRYNRQHGTYGNGDKKDASHNSKGFISGFEEQSKNRARKKK